MNKPKKKSSKKKSSKKNQSKKNQSKKNQSKKNNKLTCKELDDPKKNPNLGKTKPRVGDRVLIILKPYNNFNCISGEVLDVLTKKNVHTRGHKVRLISGEIGRTLKIINY
jgi:uncharacterized repeat protein (TIGR03833 family)